MTTALTAEGVTFAYGATTVLDGVSFAVPTGELAALIGPNGSGKSTLLRVLLGLLRPDGGTATVLGTPAADLHDRHRVGYVPQQPVAAELLPATVDDVVAAGLATGRRWWRRPGSAERAAVDSALDDVALGDVRHRRLDELSGGQRQRAFIAKALVRRPELLVLDEPTAGVDAESQRRFRDALVRVRERGGTVFLISHELSAVADDLDRVLLLRQGRIQFDGRADELAAGGVSLGVHAHDLPVWLEEHGH